MKKRILCFGDSNTWGQLPLDKEMKTFRYPGNVRWTGVLQEKLGDDYLVIEEGYCGRTTVYDDPIERRLNGLAYFEQCIDSQSPLDLIIIMLGTNDLKVRFGLDAWTIAMGLNSYIKAVASSPMIGERPQILIASPIRMEPAYKNTQLFVDAFGDRASERSSRFAEAYAEMAASVGAGFLDAALYAKASDIDGTHMMPEGHAALGAAMAEKVKEMLNPEIES